MRGPRRIRLAGAGHTHTGGGPKWGQSGASIPACHNGNSPAGIGDVPTSQRQPLAGCLTIGIDDLLAAKGFAHGKHNLGFNRFARPRNRPSRSGIPKQPGLSRVGGQKSMCRRSRDAGDTCDHHDVSGPVPTWDHHAATPSHEP
ncbi:hypothetical protein MHEI_36640 [Mycobacterium heidelbergense]|nr:hypothetical protein MHEI_36640 [Mycobacterium heidelbergense]